MATVIVVEQDLTARPHLTGEHVPDGGDVGRALDSLTRVELVAALEDRLGLSLDDEVISSLARVDDLLALTAAAGPAPERSAKVG